MKIKKVQKHTLDTSKLKKGMEIKNYKELCSMLNLLEQTGKAKQIQMKHLQDKYFSWKKKGNSIVITDVYSKPALKKLTNRKGKYSDDLTNNILAYINNVIQENMAYENVFDDNKIVVDETRETKDIYITKNKLMLALGMFNDKYPKKRIHEDFNFEFPSDESRDYSIEEFYKIANSKLTEILVNSLNSLKRKYLINWNTVFFKGYKYGYATNEVADEDEQTYIMSVLHKKLLEYGVDTEFDIIINNKSDKFYKEVNEIIKETLGCDYIYKVIHITNFTKKNIEYEINNRVNKRLFNSKVVEGLKETINKKVDRKQIRADLEREIGFEMNSFYYPIYFKDAQLALVDYFVQIKEQEENIQEGKQEEKDIRGKE